MKIKTTKTVTEEHEVELPLYRKGSVFFFRVFSETKCLQVCLHKHADTAIQICYSGMAWTISDVEDCTKEEFDAAYKSAVEQLTAIAE